MVATPSVNERSCTILVVEDEALIRDFLSIVLKRMGHIVLEARDGAEGLTVARNVNGRIDLVISDVRMPKVDGPTMVCLLQAKRPDLKVLLISGDSADSVPNGWTKNFLHKPFPPSAIEQKVQEMLARDEAFSIGAASPWAGRRALLPRLRRLLNFTAVRRECGKLVA